MSSVTSLPHLNAEASVFSPMSKVKMEAYLLQLAKENDGIQKQDYEERILITKKLKRTESSRRISYEYCRFCRNNDEKEEVYMSHVTKDSGGTVQCPVLRNYTCPKWELRTINILILFILILTPRCGETGDKAHTVSYCPKKLRRVSSGGRKVFECQDEEAEDPRIPTPMAGWPVLLLSKKDTSLGLFPYFLILLSFFGLKYTSLATKPLN